MQGLTRRELLKNAGTAGAVGTAGAASMMSGCVEDVVGAGGLKIGISQPLTGLTAHWGYISVWGFLSGIAYRYGASPPSLSTNEINGGSTFTFEAEDRTYEFVFRNTMSDPSIADSGATSLVLDEDIDILFGGADSSVVTRIIEQVVMPTGTPYIAGPASYMGMVTDPDLCGEHIFRANETQAMEARASAKYVAEETDTEEIYLLGPDNSFGRSFLHHYGGALEERGVDVVGDRLVPPGFSEFQGIFEDIDDDADSIAINFSGRTLSQFLPTFVRGNVSGDFNLRSYAPLPGQLGLGLIGNVLESELDEITEETIDDANIGALVSRYHWNQYDNPINDEFVPSFEDTYGNLPALFASGTFAAGYAVAQAVEETGSLDGNDVAEQMRGMAVEETPKGEDGYVFQEHNNQAKSEMTVARIVPNEVDNWDAPIMPSEPIARISADDAAPPADDSNMNCDLR